MVQKTPSTSYYITSTCAKRRRQLVNIVVTRASRVLTQKPIGSDDRVTRICQQLKASPHELSAKHKIRISVSQEAPAAIFTYNVPRFTIELSSRGRIKKSNKAYKLFRMPRTKRNQEVAFVNAEGVFSLRTMPVKQGLQ